MKVLSSVTSSHVKEASQLQTGRNQYRPTKSYGWTKVNNNSHHQINAAMEQKLKNAGQVKVMRTTIDIQLR